MQAAGAVAVTVTVASSVDRWPWSITLVRCPTDWLLDAAGSRLR